MSVNAQILVNCTYEGVLEWFMNGVACTGRLCWAVKRAIVSSEDLGDLVFEAVEEW